MVEVTQDVARAHFEKWAEWNVGQFSPAGFHGTNGVWQYRHNIQQFYWECWQAAVKAHCNPSAKDKRIAELEAALQGLIDDEPCRHDHHGYCQTHFVTAPCEMAAARKALAP